MALVETRSSSSADFLLFSLRRFSQVSEKGNPVIDLTSEPTTEQTDLQRAIALSLKDTQQTPAALGKDSGRGERERERERGLNELYFKHQNRMEHFWDHHSIISGELPAPKGDGCVSG